MQTLSARVRLIRLWMVQKSKINFHLVWQAKWKPAKQRLLRHKPHTFTSVITFIFYERTPHKHLYEFCVSWIRPVAAASIFSLSCPLSQCHTTTTPPCLGLIIKIQYLWTPGVCWIVKVLSSKKYPPSASATKNVAYNELRTSDRLISSSKEIKRKNLQCYTRCVLAPAPTTNK